MFPKTNRITKKRDFEKIFKNSKSFKTDLCILKIAKNNLEINRFGFVVSLKVSKKAVVRNKIRRRFVEALKLFDKHNKKGFDFLVIALPGADKAEFSGVKESLNKVLGKAGITQ